MTLQGSLSSSISDGGIMELIEKIRTLKEEKNALILAHYYQIPEIQDVADFVGDSLALAKIGASDSRDLIVLCGVRFMGETAKILSRNKKVLIPSPDAGCPMADMVIAKDLERYKASNPERTIVSYVNTTAQVKTLTDICVTSSNALSIIKQLDESKFLFLPDRNLGAYIQEQLPKKDIELWPGFCLTHQRLRGKDIEGMLDIHKHAKVLVHPECSQDVLGFADYIGSTKGIIDYATQSTHDTFIIATEEGILHPLRRENPDKHFILASERLQCKNMKKNTLQSVYECLKKEQYEICLDDQIIERAKKPLERMLALS